MLLILTTFFNGCNRDDSNQNNLKSTDQKFDIKIASNILYTYLQYLYKGDIDSAEKLYGEPLSKKNEKLSDTDLKIFGYRVDEINEVGRNGVFTVKIVKSSPEKMVSELDKYTIKVELQKDKYKITDIINETDKEAFLAAGEIRIRDKNNIKTNLIMDMSGIPLYIYAKDDAAKINKLFVPRKNFGMMGFDYTGERMAVTTLDNDVYVAVVKIDETLAAQGGGGGGGASAGAGGGAGGGGGTSQSQGGSRSLNKEMPVGKEIVSMDLIKSSIVTSLNFSLDEKNLVVQYKDKENNHTLRLYDVDSGDLINFDFEKKFPKEKFDVVFSSFDEDVMNFEVKAKGNVEKEASKDIGKWQINLKNNKAKKL